ncbi:MAG: hypothetical protein JKX83_00830 [Pseudomonadales bacterium]|nr:hypothetical protein [Pseudomonadales bacterium]
MTPTIGLYRLTAAIWGMAVSMATYWQIGLGQKVPVDPTVAYALGFFVAYMLVMAVGKKALKKAQLPTELPRAGATVYGWNQPVVLIPLAVMVIAALLWQLE